jgi:alkaline phosphatase
MSYEADRDPQLEPSLAEMTEKAIKMLSQNEKGYFLLVEGYQYYCTELFLFFNNIL